MSNACQVNMIRSLPYQPKGNQLPIQSTAMSLPECITTYNTLNNPGLKYTKGNGVCRRLMKNYQARMKASWVLDLLHDLPFYYAIGTIFVFIIAVCGILCEQFIHILLFPCIFLLYSFLLIFSKYFSCNFLFCCKNGK